LDLKSVDIDDANSAGTHRWMYRPKARLHQNALCLVM